ncbi:basic amino acid ABC transporter substrate-binding protein [Arthrobacter sp. zg-Y769]|uniref:basic amino acid ABC transporter substrate-binding protein n=1 Tax=Arthrobacter sp. zg-Y769 TaxID=2894191 RepID=UPI001E33B436|nr:basic amino acid ABC transporter substrate-binding protein [Arthrobacter sp. zg-Y769]MCC9203911.1 basic amino acid ABC transporter substrate-binding protein [Arthrobacter sp. zg-Y769]
MPYKARTITAALLAAGALSLTACGGGSEADESGLSTVNEGSLTVCSNVPFKPFEYVVDGEYTGFDIELTREIAKGMGLEHEVQNVGFDGLQSGTVLAARQCDVIAAAMSITDERAEKLAFSDPYYDSPQTLLVPADSTVSSLADLSGKKVGIQQGTTGETYARENAAGAEIMSFQTDAELFQALQAGNIDAVLQDHAVNMDHTEDGKYRISATFETGESYGFAMKKEGSEELVAKVNEQLAALQENGKYQELHDRFFTK